MQVYPDIGLSNMYLTSILFTDNLGSTVGSTAIKSSNKIGSCNLAVVGFDNAKDAVAVTVLVPVIETVPLVARGIVDEVNVI